MRKSWILLMLLTVAAALSTAACRGGEAAADQSDTQDVLLHAGAAGAPLVAVPEDDDDGDEDGDEFEEDVALDDLSQVVRDAVLAAVPGLQLTSAEIEIEAGKTAYCVHGTLDGDSMEVEVAPDGTVLEIERDD